MCNYDTNMAVIGSIDGIPLFATPREAVQWANSKGLSGFHTHNYQGQVSYMGGTNHSRALDNLRNTSTQQVTRTSSTSTSSSSSGGGGGY